MDNNLCLYCGGTGHNAKDCHKAVNAEAHTTKALSRTTSAAMSAVEVKLNEGKLLVNLINASTVGPHDASNLLSTFLSHYNWGLY
jgi:hypothetical protein